MSRQKRHHEDWNVYHVIIRCNNKQMLLCKKEIKMMLLGSFGKFQQRLGFKIYGFVIMDNHAHWLIQVQNKHGLSGVMQKVLLSFGRYYREENKFVGHFWQDRYKSINITTDHAMHEVLNYVHENPVKARIVSRSEDYSYSSIHKYLNLKNDIYYWASAHTAEIDFLIQDQNKIIPIEVKASENIKSRSLSVYRQKYKPDYVIRISARNFGYENDIKSVPLYAVFCLGPAKNFEFEGDVRMFRKSKPDGISSVG